MIHTGFVQLDRNVLCMPGLRFTARGILSVIIGRAAYADYSFLTASCYEVHLKAGDAFLTYRAIARAGGCSVGTVQKAIADLVRFKIIEIVRSTRFGTIFRVLKGIVGKTIAAAKTTFNAVVNTLCSPREQSVPRSRGTYDKEDKTKSFRSAERSGPPVMDAAATRRWADELDSVAVPQDVPAGARAFLDFLKGKSVLNGAS